MTAPSWRLPRRHFSHNLAAATLGWPMDDDEPSPDYVRFDEIEDVVVSVELVAHLVPLLDKHPSLWKWVIVGAHNALQGAMVCALSSPLSDTTGTLVLGARSAKEVLAWLEADWDTSGDPPKQRLAEFDTLLSRCTSGSEPLLVLTPQQRKDIERLHDHFRNNFAHFIPRSWSIEKAGLPRINTAALDAVESLRSRWHRLCEPQLVDRI